MNFKKPRTQTQNNFAQIQITQYLWAGTWTWWSSRRGSWRTWTGWTWGGGPRQWRGSPSRRSRAWPCPCTPSRTRSAARWTWPCSRRGTWRPPCRRGSPPGRTRTRSRAGFAARPLDLRAHRMRISLVCVIMSRFSKFDWKMLSVKSIKVGGFFVMGHLKVYKLV